MRGESPRARVTEVSEAGSVPFLQVANGADRPLLLLDGEELIGAKQNRILNTTVLVAARTEVTIPALPSLKVVRASHPRVEALRRPD